ncbi:MAG: glutamate formimidoyltransferase [Ignavibacteria bacterium]|nr:glutamate formimidoyltransferase [Ignavibacteria bacterium]
MEDRIIECVPNFSEGQNPETIKQITGVIEAVEGVKLLNVDPGFEMNRTVVTFIGNPEAVAEAAFQSIKKASELIDMSKHKGSHPRMGATDVCPFIPVSGITTEEAIELSHRVAERVGKELGIPVYMYELSQNDPKRKNLAIIRQGEYEALEEKMKRPEWKPDHGPVEFNAKAGATVMGVREFLIAYNINLNTREVKAATDIAFELREKGRSARTGGSGVFYYKRPAILKYREGSYPSGLDDFIGKTIDETAAYCKEKYGFDLFELLELNGINPQKPEGESVKIPGKFKNCKAIGWMVPEYDRAQISINLTDYKTTPMHLVYEEAKKLAETRGITVTGSEIVGMVPFRALYESGISYLKRQERPTGIPVMDVLKTAAQSLGLNDVSPFKIEERVLGLPKYDEKALSSLSVAGFADEVSRESPAPGGGSVAAMAGAIGASLASMVVNLTAYKKGAGEIDKMLDDLSVKAIEIKDKLIKNIDDDSNAFNEYMEAMRLPQNTPEEKNIRFAAMQAGLKKAVQVPLTTAKLSYEAIKICEIVKLHGNPNSITDVTVGARMALTGVQGGVLNVLINLKDIKDQDYVSAMKTECKALTADATALADKILNDVIERLS